MRVLEVISGLGRGGAETALARRLKAAPPSVETLVLSTRPDLSELNDAVARYAQLRTFSIGRIAVRPLIQEIRAFEPDLVVVHNPLETIRLALLAPASVRARLVSVAHSDRITGNRWLDGLLALPMRLASRRCRAHLAVSEIAARGQQCHGSAHPRVVHLGGSIDLDAVPEDVWPAGTQVRLLFLGRFVPAKNLLSLVAAVADCAADMRKAGACLALVGYGPLHPKLEEAVSAREVADLVIIRPPVSDPSAVLLGADAVVIASTYEGGPLTAYEGRLAGCRIFATRVGVVPEVIGADPESILVSSATDSSLAAGLQAICRLGALPSELRRERQQGARRWEADLCAADWYRVLCDLARRSRE